MEGLSIKNNQKQKVGILKNVANCTTVNSAVGSKSFRFIYFSKLYFNSFACVRFSKSVIISILQKNNWPLPTLLQTNWINDY